MVVHNRQNQLNYDQIPNLRIDGVKIERVSEFRFLGILFNDTVTWSTHIQFLKQKISKSIGIMSVIKNYVPKSCRNIFTKPSSTLA